MPLQRGKYLYYNCTNRVRSYPLPPTCIERGINARIADELVWQKVAEVDVFEGVDTQTSGAMGIRADAKARKARRRISTSCRKRL